MLTVNFTPFPELLTRRLLLRKITAADKEDVFYLRANPGIMRFIPRPLHQHTGETLQFIQMLNEGIASNEYLNWGITLRTNTSRIIGSIGYVRMKKEHYRAEVGYLLHDAFHRLGIIHEALQAVLEYGFNTMQLHSVEAVADAANIASIKVLEKSRFVREGYFKEDCYNNGVFTDSAYYSLLAQTYHALK